MRALEYFRELLEVEVFEEEDEQLLIELASRRKTLRDFNEKKAMNSVDLEEKAVKEADCGADLESASSNCRELVFPGEPQRCEFIFSYARYHYRRNGAGDGGVAESEEAEFSQLTGEKKEWVQIYDQNEDWKEAVQKRFVAEENLTRAREDRAQALLEKSRLDEKVFAAESALRQARESLNSFQKRKLDRVNSLPHSFLLTANQVLVPLDQINSALLFASPVLEKLDKRALELEDERLQITREHEELLSAGGALNKEINLLRAANKLAQAELSENFRLKFGHPIELKLLDGLKSSRKLKELKTELHELQKAGEKKVEEAQNSLRKTKDELIAQKKKSTEVLKQIAELSSEELRLNKTLDSNNRQVLKEDNDSQKQDLMRKRTELVSVVKLLTGELEELKAEIVTLKSKSVGMV